MVGLEINMDLAKLASYDDYVLALALAIEAKLTIVNLLDLSNRV
jgi:hypothetical protein